MGISKPRDVGSYVIITPNQLLMGRSQNILPDDAGVADSLPISARYRLVNHVTNVFLEDVEYERFPKPYCPSKVAHENSKSLCGRSGDDC